MRNVWCSLGRHRWAVEHNDDGERYRECRRCGAVDNGVPLGHTFDVLGPPGG
jgi:hypothetical protein